MTINGRPSIPAEAIGRLFSAFDAGYTPPQAAILASVHRNTALKYYDLYKTRAEFERYPEKIKTVRMKLFLPKTLSRWLSAEAAEKQVSKEDVVCRLIEAASKGNHDG